MVRRTRLLRWSAIALEVLLCVASSSSKTFLHPTRYRRYVKKIQGETTQLPTSSTLGLPTLAPSRDVELVLSMNGGAHDDNVEKNSSQIKWVGRSILFLVSLLYGTLNVCLRSVYALPEPPTAPALAACRVWLASICFLPVPFASLRSQPSSSNMARQPSRWLLWATGFDLALWNWLTMAFLSLGLLTCSSARAAFLFQASVLFTPILSLASGHHVPRGLLVGVALAFCGVCVLCKPGGAAITLSRGDTTLLAGALSWSIYLYRLSRASSAQNNRHRIDFPVVQLQAIKTLLIAVLCTIWWMWNSLHMTEPPSSNPKWWTNRMAWVWLAMSATGPGAFAHVLQQQGQKDVSASETNVILTLEPVFASLFGYMLLGEIVTFRELMGGAMILLAAVVSSLSS